MLIRRFYAYGTTFILRLLLENKVSKISFCKTSPFEKLLQIASEVAKFSALPDRNLQVPDDGHSYTLPSIFKANVAYAKVSQVACSNVSHAQMSLRKRVTRGTKTFAPIEGHKLS